MSYREFVETEFPGLLKEMIGMKSLVVTDDDLWALSSAIDTKLLSIQDTINTTTSDAVKQELISNADKPKRVYKKIRDVLLLSC